MVAIVQFIASYALWFYLVCTLGLFILLLLFLHAQRDRKRALFGLELEVATTRRRNFLRLMIVVVTLAMVVFFVGTVVEPNLPAYQRASPTSTPNIFATPPPTFSNVSPIATATLTPTLTIPIETSQLLATVVDQAQEITPTPTPPPAPVAPVNASCVISNPAEGSEVNGEVTFIGTATTEQFQFFKLEAYGPETAGAWASILGDVVTAPVVNGMLGTANFAGWAPGGYSIRLVIVDATSNEVAGCYVNFSITTP